MSQPGNTPPDWTLLAYQLDKVAAVVRDYLHRPRASDSPCMADLAREAEFSALPFEAPVIETTLLPLHYMNSAHDHLAALAGILRTPHTVMANQTVLRTLLTGAAHAAYLADPTIELEERVRRAMNVQLDSLTEQMRLIGFGHPQFAEKQSRRRAIVAGAARLGWKTKQQSPDARWPKEWYIGESGLPGEAEFVALLMSGRQDDTLGQFVYRYLSATSHVRPHSLLFFIDRELAVNQGDGTSAVAITMDYQKLTLLGVMAVFGCTVAMDNCVQYFGWTPDLWRREVAPISTTLGLRLNAHAQSVGEYGGEVSVGTAHTQVQ